MKIFNIPIKVHWTFLLLLTFLLVLGNGSFLLNLCCAAILTVSVLCHELGHSRMAQKLGYRVFEIELFGLGAAAKMHLFRITPKDEFLIAIAGPLVNFVFFTIGFLIYYILAATGIIAFSNVFLISFWAINLVMGVFNLTPAYPMDGGRILKAALGKYFGHVIALTWATNIAFVFAGIMMIAGVYFTAPTLFLIATFVIVMAIRDRKMLTRG